MPGAGDFDLAGFLRLIGEMGVRLPLSVEVMSIGLQERPASEIARRLADATRAVVAASKPWNEAWQQ